MFQPRFAIVFDGGFVTKKLQEKLKQPASADDIVALRDEICAHDEVKNYELLRTYFYNAPPSVETIATPVPVRRNTWPRRNATSMPRAFTISSS